ncbi:MAG: non-ribosomal peptide synthetase [Actinobacteria bacterium]|nr:non-ribosomal peptide synthetase [Actinomycetota bacterium]
MAVIPDHPRAAEGGQPVATRIFEAVDRWAREVPGAVAVDAPDGILTFGELPERISEFARMLAACGAEPEVAVALCLGRSSRDLVPALLAVWRLGAVAVPVDERHPTDRLAFVLRDAGTQLILGDTLPPGAAPPESRQVPPIGGTGGPAATAARGPLPAAAGNCAYLIYTSGTTGWPKGVEVTYRSLDTFLAALAELRLTPGGMGINAVSPAFDGWLWCTLLYLLHGQGVGIVDAGGADGAGDFVERLVGLRPRTVCLTPSLLVACADDLPPTEVLVVAGEACPPGLLQRFTGDRRVLNVYGPTEATIAATWADTDRGDDPETIGHPLPGCRAYVLDDALAPVPAGSPGELFLAGPCLAAGYRNRPALTALRFVRDPFSAEGGRMYRTGDVVRQRTDGALEYVGRRDDQVKVRGFRVELAELERTATRMPEVVAAAAFVVDTGDALGLAVRPATPEPDPAFVARVRAHFAGSLPDYLRPSTVLVTGTFPTLATGKVDRPALARLAAGVTPEPGRLPATATEALVCEVWSRLLPHPVADAEADFFDSGGHSLLAAQAVAALRRETGTRVSMQHLLANPTAAGLAAELDRLAARAPADPPDVARTLPVGR